MNTSKPRLASASDRARVARLSRVELERLLTRARRAFEAFGTSAGRSDDGDDDNGPRFGGAHGGPPTSAAASA